MEYRGVKYSIVQKSPDVWKWSVIVGKLQMLRLGEAATEYHAEIEVRRVIDRSLAVQKARPPTGKPSSS
jgi:hypothetical protein